MLFQTTLKILAGLLLLSLSFRLAGQETVIRLAATSDVHGSLFPYDFEENRSDKSSLAGVAHLVDSIRKIRNDNLVLLENGDLVQGTPVSYYANFVQKKRTNLFARILNCMDYDAATVGNHDIEAGPAVYNHLKEAFRFPYLGGNVRNTHTGSSYFQPYTVIERSGIRIAVIGLLTTGVPQWLPPHLWEGLKFQDMAETAGKLVSTVREKENPDVVVGLFHSGYGDDRGTAGDVPMEDAGRYIAQNVPGFDVIFLGHDHRVRNEILTNRQGEEVLVLNPGSNAQNLAYAELSVRDEKGGKPGITSRKGLLIPVSGVVSGKKFNRKFWKDEAEILKFSNQEIGRIGVPMQAADALFGTSALAGLIHRVQLESTGADISFTAPLSVTGSYLPGPLYVRDLFKMYRYENFLYTMRLSGSEIQRYLEYSCGLWFNRMDGPEDHLLLFRNGETPKAGLQNPSYHFDSAAGIRYVVDVTKPAGKRVQITGMENGKPFDPAGIYKVAVNSYRGSGGGGHLTTGAGIDPGELPLRIISSSEVDFRTLLMKHIQAEKIINPDPGNNWEIIPADYHKKGKQKDMIYFY